MTSTDVCGARARVSAYLPGEGLAVEEMLRALSIFAAKV